MTARDAIALQHRGIASVKSIDRKQGIDTDTKHEADYDKIQNSQRTGLQGSHWKL